MNLRAAAATVICDVLDGASLFDALPNMSAHFSDERDQAFLQAICYGVCRWYFRLDAVVNMLLDKPLKAKDQDIYSLILVGLYQLIDMRVPAHASVAETVAATKDFKKIWAKGLVNAVLRNYQRRAPEINEKIQQNNSAVYSHPDWIIAMMEHDWPEDWKNILIANNQHPPFALRVNAKYHDREEYLQMLAENELESCIIPETRSGILLKEAVDVQQLPGFSAGYVSVQDGAAQLAAELLRVAPHDRVLDACAAPGGKAMHILELTPELAELIALDNDEVRIQSIQENLQRLNLSARVICADANQVDHWWDGKLFDRILLDAPCSASGVIRRHPDIKLLRKADDIPKLAKEQLRLLTALWPLLKPGGLLVYATCSVFSLENTRVLESFIAATPDVQEEKIKASWGKECAIGRQILPGMQGMDGFYFACLRK
jgi:16S rRNA (cytosine967-C5)-methyltransferase